MFLFFTATAKGQILSIGTSGLNILNGTTVVADSLTLIPSADITISNNTLNKATTIVNTGSNPYISRVYRFTNNMLTLQINEATSLALYSADGKLLWNENVNAGTKSIGMSRLIC